MKNSRWLDYALTIIVLTILWYGASLLLGSQLLPDPLSVLGRLLHAVREEIFWEHTAVSAWRLAAALAIAFMTAVPFGLVLGSNERLDRIFAPLIYLSYPIPKIVLLPIILMLFGLGDLGKIILISLIIFFQLLITTRDAVRSLDREVVYALQSLGANRWHFYRHVVWPVALPGIFTSLRISTGTAVAVLFFVESISTSRGLGLYLIDAWGRADYTTMFVGIIALSAIGIVLYEAFDVMERRLCAWKNL
ncbi:MAG TPA: ABC transporter permease [Syntrophus sp. (in: bacteria)]|jgi:NitT/TauT family transport system permease protein|nr:ABC transporter permease [Syntrophus sp. (in: bacteria)]